MSKAEHGYIQSAFTYQFRLCGLGDCRLTVRANTREQANGMVQAFKDAYNLRGRDTDPMDKFSYTERKEI